MCYFDKEDIYCSYTKSNKRFLLVFTEKCHSTLFHSHPAFCQRVVLQFSFCGFWKCPHFSGPAPIFFKYNRNWFDFLPPAWWRGGVNEQWELVRARQMGTQPTAGDLHAWVAKQSWTSVPALLFPRLKAVYGQILEAHLWKLTLVSTEKHTNTRNNITRNIKKSNF